MATRITSARRMLEGMSDQQITNYLVLMRYQIERARDSDNEPQVVLLAGLLGCIRADMRRREREMVVGTSPKPLEVGLGELRLIAKAEAEGMPKRHKNGGII